MFASDQNPTSRQPHAGRPSMFDQHRIETPEQVELQFAIAGVGSRSLAMMIDTLIQIGALLIVGITVAVLGGFAAARRWGIGQQWMLALVIAFVFLVGFGYFALFEIFWSGQTPGKRSLGLRVIKDSGRALTVTESIARNVLRVVDQLPGIYGVGFLVALLNERSKRVGDFVAGSLVVYDRRPDERATSWAAPVATSETARSSATSGLLNPGETLTMGELILIEAFIARRSHLDDAVRYRMAREVLSKIRPKLTTEAAAAAGVETTLETLAYEAREAGRTVR